MNVWKRTKIEGVRPNDPAKFVKLIKNSQSIEQFYQIHEIIEILNLNQLFTLRKEKTK
jgi:hypothetical protein